MMNMRGLTYERSYFTTQPCVEPIAFERRAARPSSADADTYCLDDLGKSVDSNVWILDVLLEIYG